MTNQYDSKVARFEKAQDAFISLDTSRIVARGYAMIQKNDKVVASTRIWKIDLVSVLMRDGRLEVEVGCNEVEKRLKKIYRIGSHRG